MQHINMEKSMKICKFNSIMTMVWDEELNQGIELAGYELIKYNKPLDFYMEDEKAEQMVAEIYSFMKANLPDAAISWDYFYIVSEVCEKLGIPYISWIYDCPMYHSYAYNIHNSCNYIFSFDKNAVKDIRSKGGNAYHMPLAVNTFGTNNLIITDEEINFYQRDITFVGTLYQGNPYKHIEKAIPKAYRDRFDELVIRQFANWKKNIIYNSLTADELEMFNSICCISGMDKFPYFSKRLFYEGLFLARKYTEYERRTLLNMLSQKHQVTIYNARDDISVIKNIECRPEVSYETEAPKVYYSSKINLNMTLKSIETGIPLRAFSIMGVGGFLMSNYQEEFEEFFEPGKDMALFNSAEEMLDLSDFYLRHENERIRIAMNGYQKTSKYHTIDQRIRKMVEISQGK